MKILLLVLTLILSPFILLQAQMVNEWKTVANGAFTGSEAFDNLKVAEKKYIAAVSNSLGPPAISIDSLDLVLLSSDAGETWITAIRDKITNLDSNYMPLPGDWHARWYQSVEMPSRNLILLLGIERMNNETQYEHHPFILRSTDFGNNWDRITISNDTLNFYNNFISMYDDNNGIMLTGRIPSTDNPLNAGLYNTINGGLNWAEINTGDLLGQSNYYYSIKAFSDKKFAVIGRSAIVTTEDGGATWVNKTQPYETNVSFSDICFLNENIWFISCIGPSTGQGQTKWNVIYKTTDAGTSWEKIMSTKVPLEFGLNGISFYDELNGIALTYSNILKTSDGGINWEIQTLPFDYFLSVLNKAVFFDSNRAVVNGIEEICLFTGRKVLAPPSLYYTKESAELLKYTAHWNNVYWDNVSKADKYIFQLAEFEQNAFPEYFPPGFEQNIIYENNNSTDTLIELTGKLKYEKDYYMRVKAIYGSEQSDWSKPAMIRTQKDTTTKLQLDSLFLIVPADTKYLSPNHITFKWTSVKDAQRYTLIVVQPINIGSGDFDFQFKNLTDTSKTIDTLLANVTYLWWVIAEADGYLSSYTAYRYLYTTDESAVIEELYPEKVQLSPNPAESIIYIFADKDIKDKIIQIFTIEGIIVIETEYKDRIDVSRLSAGVYFLKAGDKIYKFVKM
ncbi:MAG: T9SS type A sorting domain-containing protein [Ignavibacteriae bacterium]|nr:T9SS type A sorting domain-containing protein [Ignavibacteriota bacterium]